MTISYRSFTFRTWIVIIIIILRKRVSQTPALAVDDLRLRRAGRAHNVHTLSTPPSPWGHYRHIFGIFVWQFKGYIYLNLSFYFKFASTFTSPDTSSSIKIKVCTMSTLCPPPVCGHHRHILMEYLSGKVKIYTMSKLSPPPGGGVLISSPFLHFMWTFTMLDNAMVSQNWQLSGMTPSVVIIVIS